MDDDPLLVIVNARTGKPIGERIVPARSLRTRLIGLLGRSSLVPGDGLWLEPCSSIHMFFMRFAIDAVFVDRAGVVTRAVKNLRPWRIAFGGRRAHAVVEVAVGTIAASQTRAGDRLTIDVARGSSPAASTRSGRPST